MILYLQPHLQIVGSTKSDMHAYVANQGISKLSQI
jgi:hypothetical protein